MQVSSVKFSLATLLESRRNLQRNSFRNSTGFVEISLASPMVTSSRTQTYSQSPSRISPTRKTSLSSSYPDVTSLVVNPCPRQNILSSPSFSPPKRTFGCENPRIFSRVQRLVFWFYHTVATPRRPVSTWNSPYKSPHGKKKQNM